MRRLGCQSAWIDALPEMNKLNEALGLTAMRAYLDVGDFEQALKLAEYLMPFVHRRKIVDNYMTEVYMSLRQLRRLTGAKGLSAEEWVAVFEIKGMRASQRLVLQVLSGRLTREKGLEKVPSVVDGGELHYWLALEDLAVGKVEAAREALTALNEAHPTWLESASARRLMTAMDAWSEEEAAKFGNGVAGGSDKPQAEPADKNGVDEF